MMINQLADWLFTITRSSSINWKVVLFGAAIFDFTFKTWLDFRQYKLLGHQSLKEMISKEEFVDHETFRKSQLYNRATLKFEILKRASELCLKVFVLKFDLLPKVWTFWQAFISRHTGLGDKTVGAAGTLTMYGISSLASLPFDYYRNFIVEQKFGFNKSTVGIWLADTLKLWALAIIFVPPIILSMQAIIGYFGNMFVFYLVLFFLFVTLVASVVYPAFLAPFFNNYTPLEDGELRKYIEQFSITMKFPLGKVYVVDGSTRSSHSNAYFIGFPWFKQIVLYDTLIKDQSTEQIVAVLAHEIGHWKKNHMVLLVASGLAAASVNFFSLALFLENAHFFESLGFESGITPVSVALYVYIDALVPITTIMTFFKNSVARYCEYEADRFAVQNGQGTALRSALIALNKSNLSLLVTDKLYSTFHHNHPIMTERLKAIDAELVTLN